MTPIRKAVLSLLTFLIASASLLMAQGTYALIDVPGANGTECYGINNAGDVVGGYGDSSGGHGFLLSGGVFTTLDVPGAKSTQANGINDVGQIVGVADDTYGFLYDIATQTFTTLRFPHDGSYTFPTSINNAGIIVGSVWPGTGQQYAGFELGDGIYTTIKAPGAEFTGLSSINNLDEGVVWGAEGEGNVSFYLLNQGKLTKLNGSDIVFPSSINDVGALTGLVKVLRVHVYYAGFVKQGNLRTMLRGNDWFETWPYGINNSGTVAGLYFESIRRDVPHCFIWTPPADAAKK